MSFSYFSNKDFVNYVQQKIKADKNQKLCCKLSGLSKNHNLYFKESIDSAVVEYHNLEDLAASNYASQIQFLKLSVPSELERLDELRYISTKYFVNIQSIKLRFVKSDSNNYDELEPEKTMIITENFTIRGLTAQKNQHVYGLKIEGSYNVNISNSKFDGLSLYTDIKANVELTHVKFQNSPKGYFIVDNSTSVIMKDIFVKNWGECGVDGSQNVVVSNITAQKCDFGFHTKDVPYFEIANADIFKCNVGMSFWDSNGKIRDVVVKECLKHGIQMLNSHASYNGLLCVNNGGDNIFFLADDDGTFFQGV
eukprot:TRINITY_DN1128_c0_g2_i5.p1 TRINITY_DN1128_c0_g2~~TRINITY_DN1128_c0_g2_i5.p1  ORF type:complete len:309 (-),score=32.37 TRINITY_DN1128_c0_g2_i5:141-1067(-)